jgi:hypothetical protein
MHPFRSTTFPAACQQSIGHGLLDGCSTSRFYPWAEQTTSSGELAGSICQTETDRVSVRSISEIERATHLETNLWGTVDSRWCSPRGIGFAMMVPCVSECKANVDRTFAVASSMHSTFNPPRSPHHLGSTRALDKKLRFNEICRSRSLLREYMVARFSLTLPGVFVSFGFLTRLLLVSTV